MTSKNNNIRSGFTLVEIMIVVVIIGLLAAMAIPAFEKVRNNSYASRIANDFRIFAGAFEVCALEHGEWPPDGSGNNLPAIARPYLANTAWSEVPPNGGYWDWEINRLGVIAAVALQEGSGNLDIAVYIKVDQILDDGNLSTGSFFRAGNRYAYVLQAE